MENLNPIEVKRLKPEIELTNLANILVATTESAKLQNSNNQQLENHVMSVFSKTFEDSPKYLRSVVMKHL